MKKYILPSTSGLVIISLIYFYLSFNQSFSNQLLKSEKNIRDSLTKKIVILAQQSDSINNQIRLMSETLQADRVRLSNELNKIKNAKPPVINYNYYTDSALIVRLSGH